MFLSPRSGGSDQPPVIIIRRRKKRPPHQHHGGAWKVAYADFVTAMMSFFLLLWLLNVTTSEQKRGIADWVGAREFPLLEIGIEYPVDRIGSAANDRRQVRPSRLERRLVDPSAK